MTGEMTKREVTRESYPQHFAIAEALGGSVEPFDQYQGPYVCIGDDIRIGSGVYPLAPIGLGVIRLWIIPTETGEFFTIYNEASNKASEPYWWDDTEAAIDAARSVVG